MSATVGSTPVKIILSDFDFYPISQPIMTMIKILIEDGWEWFNHAWL